MIRLLRSVTLLSFACVSSAVAGDAIGFAYVDGMYRVNGAGVRGSATLFDGATLETGDAPARLQLNRGARVWLAPGSRTQVLSNGIVLLAGLGQLQGASGYPLEARAIKVLPSQPDSVVRVQLDESGGAVVMPVKGAAEVLNKRGMRVGNVVEGSAVRFSEQPGANDAVRVSGCVSRQGDALAVTDRITNVRVRLRGHGIEEQVGRAVEVVGTEDHSTAQGAPMMVKVSELRRVEGDCRAAAGPVLLAAARMPGPQQPAPQAAPALSIVIVDGEGAINNIRQRTAREPIVQVEDRNRKPVAGALVLFALPDSGPSGTFANGARTLSVTTDAQGRAVAHGLTPNDVEGKYNISVTASYAGATATAVITQTNAIAVAAAAAGTAAAGTAAAGTAAAGAATAGAGTAGLSTAATVAIIGGVAAGGTVAGLAASGAIFGGGSPQPPASR